MAQRGGVSLKSFGRALRDARKLKKVTLREVGEFVGLSIGYISDIEHDRKRPPDLNTIEKFEKFLGIKDGHLVILANRLRNIVKPTLTQHIKADPELSAVFLRAAKLQGDKKEKVMKSFREKLEEIEGEP